MSELAPSDDVARLLKSAYLQDHDAPTRQMFVPEHAVKAALRERGIKVPEGTTTTDPGAAHEAVDALTTPLVLKAYGPGLLHKSDVGAVRLNLNHESLGGAAEAMRQRLELHGLTAEGFLIEEQQAPGIELIVGVVRDPAFGHLVLLGLGGVATELLDVSAVRVAPLTRSDAEDLVNTFPGAPLLSGARGAPAVDRDGLIDLLLSVAGRDGIVSEVASHLLEFECNPVVVTPNGATALDARLVLAAEGHTRAPDPPKTDFARLFAPHSIAVAGASTKGTGFGNRFLAAYRDAGWTDGLFAIHPSAQEIDGVLAYPRVTDVPGGVDYLLVAVPASTAVDLVKDAAGQVAFVHVISGGFRELGSEGAALEQLLSEAIADTSTRLLGPNCIGIYSPRGRQAFTLGASKAAGNVSVVSQSGGLSGDLVTVGRSRELRYANLASIGNSIDVSPAELVSWLVDDPDTDVIGLYLEGVTEGRRLVEAFHRAAGRKPVVVLTGGLSRQGAAAVSSHTGSMTGAPRVWEAVSAASGITLVHTFEDMVSTLCYLQHYTSRQDASGQGVLVTGLGGGASVLATDACDRAGLELTPLDPEVQADLRAMGHGAGTSVANPVEIPIGPASDPNLLVDTLNAILNSQAFGDVLVHLNVSAYYGYGTRGVKPLIAAVEALLGHPMPARLAVVTRNLDVAVPEDAALMRDFFASTGLPMFRSFDEAALAIAAAQRFADTRQGGTP